MFPRHHPPNQLPAPTTVRVPHPADPQPANRRRNMPHYRRRSRDTRDEENNRVGIPAGQLIEGAWVDAPGGRTWDVVNPATEEPVATVPWGGAQDCLAAIDA